jgi:glycosyltransferase involved in cell wall biosynthesis
MVDAARPPIGVLLVCSGIGYAMRGFETFAIECHAALRRDPRLRTVLVRAHGPAGEGERTARTVNRDTRIARLLGRAARRDGYFAEQMIYALGLLPVLRRERPDVVLFSDWALGSALGRWRALTRSRYRLLLCNGAPGPPPYDWSVDHVQQLTPAYHAMAMEAGEPPARHTLLPLGVALEPELRVFSRDERLALRERLGLPREREIVLSVAALNIWHKRLDYVVREVASLEPRPYLVMLGQREEETGTVLDLARALLGPDGFTARTVAPDAVADHYRCADAFVLGSLHEASGRVLLEALGRGLPTLCHDSEVTRFVTGEHGRRADLSRAGALAGLLAEVRRDGVPEERRRAQHRFAYDTFGWDRLLPRYVEMIEACAAATPRWRRSG